MITAGRPGRAGDPERTRRATAICSTEFHDKPAPIAPRALTRDGNSERSDYRGHWLWCRLIGRRRAPVAASEAAAPGVDSIALLLSLIMNPADEQETVRSLPRNVPEIHSRCRAGAARIREWARRVHTLVNAIFERVV